MFTSLTRKALILSGGRGLRPGRRLRLSLLAMLVCWKSCIIGLADTRAPKGPKGAQVSPRLLLCLTLLSIPTRVTRPTKIHDTSC